LQRLETTLPGVWELRPNVLRDERGFFLETYHLEKFASLGITEVFVQDNHSCSIRRTLRGLHYQLRHPQVKLCRVVEGEALDVAVDLRVGSPHFGRWAGVLLSAQQQNQLYIPAGFAHGFLALTETVQFLYKCSDFYSPADDYGIRWNDPGIGVDWGIVQPLLSDKDRTLPTLATVPQECLPRYPQK
jgi:dTDP-4-dehydrorhamnose 3,5-epimerase